VYDWAMNNTKHIRLPLMVSSAEVEAIDAWRYGNMIPSRAEAIRQLIARGLQADPPACRGECAGDAPKRGARSEPCRKISGRRHCCGGRSPEGYERENSGWAQIAVGLGCES